MPAKINSPAFFVKGNGQEKWGVALPDSNRIALQE